jgi:hypothetical protein
MLGPVADLGGTGLDVTRKIFVSETEGVARFLEVLTNNSGADVTVDVTVGGNLGSDEETDLADFTSSSDTTVDASDVWIANHKDLSDPALGFFFGEAEPTKSEDDIFYTWPSVTVPDGETVIIIHWGFQRTGERATAVRDMLRRFEEQGFPSSFFEGMTTDEALNNVRDDGPPTVTGEAGAAAPFEMLTITNTTASTSAMTRASSDGSFGASRFLCLEKSCCGRQVHHAPLERRARGRTGRGRGNAGRWRRRSARRGGAGPPRTLGWEPRLP